MSLIAYFAGENKGTKRTKIEQRLKNQVINYIRVDFFEGICSTAIQENGQMSGTLGMVKSIVKE